jgi:hypothetical protein
VLRSWLLESSRTTNSSKCSPVFPQRSPRPRCGVATCTHRSRSAAQPSKACLNHLSRLLHLVHRDGVLTTLARSRLLGSQPRGHRVGAPWTRNPLATIRTTGSQSGEYPEAGWVPHLPSHVHNFADSEQRGSEGSTGAPTSCEQSHYAGSLRSGGYAEQEAGTKQTCGSTRLRHRGRSAPRQALFLLRLPRPEQAHSLG